MEDVLALYATPYDPRFPVVCFDERPCFLIGDKIDPQSMEPGQVRREHYEYEKNGSAVVLAAIEPLTGTRVFEVQFQRTRKEYTLFFQSLAARYPRAEKIRIVQDNLNTHSCGSFYQHLPAAEARELADRFEFHYTPKSASWLNMIEIEFSALARQCLSRRIPDYRTLQREVLAFAERREKNGTRIEWQFSIAKARNTMNRHYTNVLEQNKCYKTT